MGQRCRGPVGLAHLRVRELGEERQEAACGGEHELEEARDEREVVHARRVEGPKWETVFTYKYSHNVSGNVRVRLIVSMVFLKRCLV